MVSRQVSLWVNEAPIQLEGFTQNFVEQVITGMVTSLKGTREIKSLKLSIKGAVVEINLNGILIPLNPFATKFMRNTITGMAFSLKGVDQIDELEISIIKQAHCLPKDQRL